MATIEYSHLNSKGLYIYPCDPLIPENDLRLLYSPMARKAVWINSETAINLEFGKKVDEKLQTAFNILSDFVPLKNRTGKVRNVEDYPLLTVLPNQNCNLNCSYCYSKQVRSNMKLDFVQLKTAIDFFIEKKEKPLSISFMGGGEPMLSWQTVSNGILYAKEKAGLQNIPIDFTIITNGTIMTEDMLNFIHDHRINMSISFDIIEEIQNKQRGEYDKVVDTINRLIFKNVIPQINATITPDNVNQMEEMYDVLDSRFPQITKMMFEPVTSVALFPKANNLDVFLKKYADNYLKIDLKARSKNKSLTSFPYLRTVFPVERACAGEFCITAEGKISGCYCITTKKDPGHEKMIYGKLSEKKGKVFIKKDIFKNILNDNVYSQKKCDACVVKWNCGGGCFFIRNLYSEEYQDVFCNFTRNFVQRVILRKFERKYNEQYSEDIQLNHQILEY